MRELLEYGSGFGVGRAGGGLRWLYWLSQGALVPSLQAPFICTTAIGLRRKEYLQVREFLLSLLGLVVDTGVNENNYCDLEFECELRSQLEWASELRGSRRRP